MAQIEAGQKLKDYVFDTAFESDVKLSDKVKNADKTILLFLRYYGCRICQLDMREYAEAYDRIKAKNARNEALQGIRPAGSGFQGDHGRS